MFLLETWVEEKRWKGIERRLPKGYVWSQQWASRRNNKGRAKGGMIVGRRKEIEGSGEENRESEREGIMVEKIKVERKIWNIIGIYMNEEEEERWDCLKNWIKKEEEMEKTIIGGDFNARTGKEGGRIQEDEEVEEEERRSSLDGKINKAGRRMIEILEETGWFIMNGGLEGDKEGRCTYEGPRGTSVINYVLGNEESWNEMEGIEIADKIDSDHFPVVVKIKGKGGGERKKGKRKRWCWSEEGKEEFNEKAKEIWGEEEEKTEWKKVKEKVNKILKKGQEGRREEQRRGWWDEECRVEKKKVRTALRGWRRGEKRREEYRKIKKEYKDLCEEKKRREVERWIEEVKRVKTEKQIWEKIERERKKRGGGRENLEIKEWEEYFRNIMGGVKYRMRVGERGEMEDGGMNELRKEEVRSALSKVREGKAEGGDGIPGEVWKYGGEKAINWIWKICN
ncbi:golgin subfamily A member 6-like protein 6 [Cardiocondyla obscurior]|uniref:golgin subfamily A member 6-like protein 6 n=1 Tax=Cardiocondyla obscurior TaxID=286306 RepID=UPI003965613D